MPDPRYLNDPEEESEPWTEPIEAEDDQSAQETCQELADEYNVELTDVTHQDGNNYDCHFQ
ncbi:MAG: hypothetical protein KME23_03070 [Goleter apudmare HA4340-LM2]|jgi:hypothetical protein|nr:hypothetical protein [Goleter apudmare HA4340-LM2]